MKTHTLLAAMLLSVLAVHSASATTNLIAQNFGTGLTTSTGAALDSGTIKFGLLPSGYDFSTGGDVASLNSSFVEVASYTGAINAFATDGFFDLSLPYNEAGTFGGTPYDLSADTSNVAGDIAGSAIYMWVLNTGMTEHAVFSASFWTDAQTPLDNSSSFSPDPGTPGLAAYIGTLGTGPDIGAGAASNQLASTAAIPEPSRAVLGFLGLGALFRRRRR